MHNLIEQIRTFYHNTVTELKKCTWPTRDELTESTVVVIVSVVILSVFVGVADWGIQMAIRLLTATL